MATNQDVHVAAAVAAEGAGFGQRIGAIAGGASGMLLVSSLALLGLWWAGSAMLPASVLPGPPAVLTQMIENAQGKMLWTDMGHTLRRIFFAFIVAMSVATALGFAMALSKRADDLFRIVLILGVTMPALVLILLSYMIVGLNDTAAIIGAALPVIAVLTINIREGVRSIDTRIQGMARAFRATPRQMLLDVMTPQVVPVLLASTRFGIGLIWKMVLFVELLGRSDGIGYRIEFYYQMYNMKQVLALALSFVIVMLLIEVGIIGQAERRLYRWRAR